MSRKSIRIRSNLRNPIFAASRSHEGSSPWATFLISAREVSGPSRSEPTIRENVTRGQDDDLFRRAVTTDPAETPRRISDRWKRIGGRLNT